jgi:hypothetical protein
MVIIVVSYIVNDTIVTADDVEKKLGLTVLGSIPLDEEEFDGRGKVKHSKKKSKGKKASK